MADDSEFTPQQEAEKYIRRARMKAREIEAKLLETGGTYDALIYDSYNAMFMAARAALHVMEKQCNSHRTVASNYKHEIVEKKLIDPKFADHLHKIQVYWEEEQAGTKHEIDAERAQRIFVATRDIVDALAVVAGVKAADTKMAQARQLYNG
ncbi:MAG: HEPN domain-containing protein [bacterium]